MTKATMRIEALWQALEAEAQAGSAGAWLTRFALPQLAQPLLVALETAPNRRALLLPLPKVAIPAQREWPECRGLEVFSAALSGQPHLGIGLRDPACADIFTALAEDVAPRVALAPNPSAAATALLARLQRWQKFLAAGTAGLSEERQRGLYGELHTLRRHLLPALGAVAAIEGWRAPQAAHQDFQFASGAVEVKTTTAKQPQTVRITSERQLDDTGIAALFLHVVVLDEREVDGRATIVCESLPSIIRDLRQQLKAQLQAMEALDDSLLDAGYLEADAPRYENLRFTLRREHTYRLRHGFPRLTEINLPVGVGDVSYALSLAAVEPFAVNPGEMAATFQLPVEPISKNQRKHNA